AGVTGARGGPFHPPLDYLQPPISEASSDYVGSFRNCRNENASREPCPLARTPARNTGTRLAMRDPNPVCESARGARPRGEWHSPPARDRGNEHADRWPQG